MHSQMHKLQIPSLALILGLIGSASAHAGTYNFFTAAGATEASGEAVNVSAIFTTSANQVEIKLTNLIGNQTDVAQNVSGMFFTLDPTKTTGTLTSSSGKERIVGKNKSFTDGSSVATGWDLTNSSGTFHLNDLGSAVGPAHTLLGSPNSSNIYSSANGSIAGNKPHNAFLSGTLDFIINVQGVTANTKITSATFSFGTAAGNNVNAVPEPAFYQLSALCLLGGVGLLRLRKARHTI